MANKFYVPGEQRAARVGDLFAVIATRYDLINDFQSLGLHRWWKRRLTRLADVQRGELALDLCCGTGDVTFSLARKGALVVGLDFSGPMLAVAESRKESIARRTSRSTSRRNGAGTPLNEPAGASAGFRRPGPPDRGTRKTDSAHEPPLARPPASAALRRERSDEALQDPSTAVMFLHGNAMAIPFADESFEIVTMSYGLRNLAGMGEGLREMCRVAKPGGRVLVLDFGKPPNRLWRAIYFAYLKACVPWFGKMFCGDSDTYAYILESLRRYPAQEGVAAAMRDTGFVNVRIVNLLGGVMSINCGQKKA
jgi:ubiquinone/menaquinone biosynthesis C-methylase UbiE